MESILNLLYPRVCGICGKISSKPVCPKCNLELKEFSKFRIIKKGQIQDSRKENDDYIDENMNFDELIYMFKYEGKIRNLILQYKFREKSYMYKSFVYFLLNNKKMFENIKKYDKIIPVPISKKRDMERGYNQSYLVAKEIAKHTGIEVENNCLIKNKNIIEQSKLSKEKRFQNIEGVYTLKNAKNIKGKSVLLFDDIYTTGSTANECCKMLKMANPKKIGVLVLARD